ncbi:TspO/MBR family protein [Streptomyces noursei]
MKAIKCAIPLDESSVIYAATEAAVAAAARIGSRAVAPDSRWYRSLRKPSWQPPSRTFGAVWSALYVSIAWAGGHALSNTCWWARRGLAISLGANLTLNAAWRWMFFGRRSPRPVCSQRSYWT